MPGLHFEIVLDEKHRCVEDALRREIESRWPSKRPAVATCEIVHGDAFCLEIDGWPACQESIRKFLLERIRGWMSDGSPGGRA